MYITTGCYIIFRNYIIVVPQSWEDEKNIDIYVQMLNPVSYETIEGKLVDDNNKTVGTGSLSLTSGTFKSLTLN